MIKGPFYIMEDLLWFDWQIKFNPVKWDRRGNAIEYRGSKYKTPLQGWKTLEQSDRELKAGGK